MKALYYKLCPHLQRTFPSCNSLLIVSFIYYSLLYSKLPVRILLYFRAMLIILFSFLNSKVQGKSLDYIAKFIAMQRVVRQRKDTATLFLFLPVLILSCQNVRAGWCSCQSSAVRGKAVFIFILHIPASRCLAFYAMQIELQQTDPEQNYQFCNSTGEVFGYQQFPYLLALPHHNRLLQIKRGLSNIDLLPAKLQPMSV